MRPDLSLKDKQGIVQSLWTAVNEGGGWLKNIPQIVRTVIETEAWRERDVDGRIIKHDRFIDFITAKPREGCGWPPEKVEALIKDDAAVLAMWQQATGGQGSRNDLAPLPYNGRKSGGNSKAVLTERLARDFPHLHERVVRDEISAYDAAIQAGFRKKPSPFEQVRKLLPKLSAEERFQLMQMLRNNQTVDRKAG